MSTKKLATFRRKNQIPPGGKWFFIVKETGAFFDSVTSKAHLVVQVREHYAANKLTAPENLEEIIDDYICHNSPPGFCDNAGDAKPRMNLFTVVQFSEVLFRKLRAGIAGKEFYVSQPEAEERAKICIGCKLNLRHLCTTCHGLSGMASQLVSNRKSIHDSWLGACAVCGCLLSAKIHVKKEHLREFEEGIEEVPDNCWMKKGGG